MMKQAHSLFWLISINLFLLLFTFGSLNLHAQEQAEAQQSEVIVTLTVLKTELENSDDGTLSSEAWQTISESIFPQVPATYELVADNDFNEVALLIANANGETAYLAFNHTLQDMSINFTDGVSQIIPAASFWIYLDDFNNNIVFEGHYGRLELSAITSSLMTPVETLFSDETELGQTYDIDAQTLNIKNLGIKATGLIGVKGTASNDIFNVLGHVGYIDGGAGADTLTASNTANVWQINGINSGLLLQGDEELVVNFTDIENLMGGDENDTFNLLANGSISGSISGGEGSNNLIMIHGEDVEDSIYSLDAGGALIGYIDNGKHDLDDLLVNNVNDFELVNGGDDFVVVNEQNNAEITPIDGQMINTPINTVNDDIGNAKEVDTLDSESNTPMLENTSPTQTISVTTAEATTSSSGGALGIWGMLVLMMLFYRRYEG